MRGILVILILAALIYLALNLFQITGGKEGEGVLEKPSKTRIAVVKTDLNQIALSVERYYMSKGELPSSLKEVLGYVPSDPWGRKIKYTVLSESSFELRSAGPDRRFDTGDDVTLIR